MSKYLDATYVITSQTYGEFGRRTVTAQARIHGLREEVVSTGGGAAFVATWALLETQAIRHDDGSVELNQVTWLRGEDGEYAITLGLRSDLADLCPTDWQDAALAAYGEAMGAEPIPEAVSA